MSTVTDRLIDALSVCPCCKASRREENGPEQGIPEHYQHESVFDCGSAVFLQDQTYTVSRACPWPLNDKIWDLQEEVVEAFEADEEEQP